MLEIEIWDRLNELPQDHSGIEGLERIFDIISEKIEENNHLMREFLIVLLVYHPIKFERVSNAEIMLAFPNLKQKIPARLSMPYLIMENIERAVSMGEIAGDIDKSVILHSILSIVFGLPMAIFSTPPILEIQHIKTMFKDQFELLLSGIGAKTTGSK